MTRTNESGELRLRVLAELCRADGCRRRGDLAETIGTVQDNVSTILRRLEVGGFVQRAEAGCWEATQAGVDYVERIRAFVSVPETQETGSHEG